MALDNVYYPHTLRLPSPELTHLTDVNPDRGLQLIMESQAGSPTPCFVGVAFTDPVLNFSTKSLKPLIDTINGGVEAIVRDLSGDDVEMWYRAGRAMEVREDAATAIHVVGRLVQSAMLYWTQITCQNGVSADAQASIVTAKRGAADPMQWLGGQQLPGREGCSRIYGMGPVYLNGVKMDGVTGFTLSSNVQTEPISADGETSNIYQGVRTHHVQCELQTHDMQELYDSNDGGDEFSTLEIYLQRMITNDIFANASDPSHIKITLNGGLKTVPGPGNVPVSLSPMFYTKEQLGVATHEFDTSTAIV